MARTLIHLPSTLRLGDVIEVRATIGHPMETGYRPGADGKVLPRDLIRRLRCRYDDGSGWQTVFEADLHAAISANPYFGFPLRLSGSGRLEMVWEGDKGFRHAETVPIRLA